LPPPEIRPIVIQRPVVAKEHDAIGEVVEEVTQEAQARSNLTRVKNKGRQKARQE
jgi:hypothetical protein